MSNPCQDYLKVLEFLASKHLFAFKRNLIHSSEALEKCKQAFDLKKADKTKETKILEELLTDELLNWDPFSRPVSQKQLFHTDKKSESWFKIELFNLSTNTKNKTKEKNLSVGYLKIENFFENTSSLIEVLKMFRKTADFLILDLRDNPGGELAKALELGNFLGLSHGPFVGLYRPNSPNIQILKNNTDTPVWNIEKLVVLTNEKTKSSAEVLAGTLQDYGALLLGRTTYGKGSYQELLSLSDFQNQFLFPGFVYLTAALTIRPSGHWIEKEGITPDLFIPSLNLPLKKSTTHKSINIEAIDCLLECPSTLEGWQQAEKPAEWIRLMQNKIQEMASTPEFITPKTDLDLEAAKRVVLEKITGQK